MVKQSNKIATRWIRETRKEFRAFLDETDFPDPQRFGERGPVFKYPEWLIMFIAILSVKLKVKSYVQIHKMAVNSESRHLYAGGRLGSKQVAPKLILDLI